MEHSYSAFFLELQSENNQVRTVRYDPANGVLCWEDTGEDLRPTELWQKNFALDSIQSAFPVSPDNPAGKNKSLKLIKIQVGFGCNYSCHYCSQKQFRNPRPVARDAEIENFLGGMESWFDGGSDGRGRDVRFEFWGGETLIYWKTVRSLAKVLREKYPAAHLLIFTNGSLLSESIVQELIELRIHTVISHDGLQQKEHREDEPSVKKQDLIQKLHRHLHPEGLFSVNLTLSQMNPAIKENKKTTADLFGIPYSQLNFGFDVLMAFDKSSSNYAVQSDEQRKKFTARVFEEIKDLKGEIFTLPVLMNEIIDFHSSLKEKNNLRKLSQRCHMDSPESIAVDLQGRVLTCQNTTADSGHQIGTVKEFDKIRLTTAHHWSTRKECSKCPVVSLCKGSCMFLEGELFQKTCDNYFSFYLGFLAFILHDLTGMTLVKVSGSQIRSKNVDHLDVMP